MFRRANASYKHGRVTMNEASLMKLKRFTDAEAEIIGFQALVRDNGQVCELLGALVVRDLVSGVQFEIGTGYSLDLRDKFWQRRAQLMGACVKYKHFERGAKPKKPRHAVFLGLRAPEDR
jgi:DNA ligase-1